MSGNPQHAGGAHAPAVAGPATVAVFDIDGVLADVRHRLHHLDKRPKDWSAFFAAASADPPLQQGLELAHVLAADHAVVYVTGRPSRLGKVTRDWLQRHDLPVGPLVMRRSGDFRPARIAKLELVREIDADSPVHVVVDDDPEVVRALREAGFAVFAATWAGDADTLHTAQEHDGRT